MARNGEIASGYVLWQGRLKPRVISQFPCNLSRQNVHIARGDDCRSDQDLAVLPDACIHMWALCSFFAA
jgi:hypothetical protein